MKANAVNLASFTNALCHLNATPLSVTVLAPCAWGENLVCGVAWQSVLLWCNGAWQSVTQRGVASLTTKRHSVARQIQRIQRHSTANGTHNTANSVRGKWGGACGRSRQSENGAVFGRRISLSLSRCSHLWHAFGLNLRGFFAHFVVVLSRFILDFAHFIAITFYLIANFSYFIAVFSHLFAYKRHFLGHFVF